MNARDSFPQPRLMTASGSPTLTASGAALMSFALSRATAWKNRTTSCSIGNARCPIPHDAHLLERFARQGNEAEIVLIMLPPAPDCGEIGHFGLAARNRDRVATLFVVICPDRPRFAGRLLLELRSSQRHLRFTELDHDP